MRRDGLSLVEFFVIVAIVASVAAIAIPALLNARIKKNETTAVQTRRKLKGVPRPPPYRFQE